MSSFVSTVRSWLAPSLASKLDEQQIAQACEIVMQHIQLPGRCECLLIRHRDTAAQAFLVIVSTTLTLSAADTIDLRHYISRKMREMMALDAIKLYVKVIDATDLLYQAKKKYVSTERIRAQVQAAKNKDGCNSGKFDQLRELRESMKRRRVDARNLEVPDTNIGSFDDLT